jgi:RNA polymerase sigma-B factor
VRAAETTNVIAKARLLEKAVLVNLPIADRLAMRYSGRGIPSQDLVQVARLGLVQAAQRFDPDAGFDFLSYAVPTITGELKRHFRDRGWTVRPPRRIQELQPRVRAASSTLTQTLGRTPSRAHIAAYLSVDEASVVETLVADGCFAPTSLDRPVVSDSRGGSTWADALGQDDPALARVEARLTLAPVIRKLSDRDRLVLRLRFEDGLTQEEIGRIIGVTQMQVSRILARILRLARDELAS